jgi:hypothetical protein
MIVVIRSVTEAQFNAGLFMALKIWSILDLREAYASMRVVRGFGVRALLFWSKPASDTSGFNVDTGSWFMILWGMRDYAGADGNGNHGNYGA